MFALHPLARLSVYERHPRRIPPVVVVVVWWDWSDDGLQFVLYVSLTVQFVLYVCLGGGGEKTAHRGSSGCCSSSFCRLLDILTSHDVASYLCTGC